MSIQKPNDWNRDRRPREAPPRTGGVQSVSSKAGSTIGMSTYAVREAPLGSARGIRVVGIGAGPSGINMTRRLRLQLDNYEHVIYEKNSDVGGSWHESRYPGCRCDIPSHNYQFSWRPKKDWASFFAAAEDIGAYLGRVCDEENMRDMIKTEHRVVAATWDETRGVWLLSVENMRTGREFDDYAHFLIDTSGILNKWKWPDIEGLNSFRGDLIHSARWPAEFEYKDKVVAVIGNGSSGIQIVPAMQPTVKQLVHIVRTPAWIVPPHVQVFSMGEAGQVLRDIGLDEDENFAPSQIERFKNDSAFYRKFVKGIEKEVNNTFPIILKDGPTQAYAQQQVRAYMTAMLGGDEELCAALIPDYPLGCKRLTPAPAYLQSLTQPNVKVVTEGVRRIVPDGIELLSGEVLKLDAIVCATGYDVSFCPRFPLRGRNGNLQDLWRENVPQAYMSCSIPGVPNYFTFLGPNAPIGHGSTFTLGEHIAKYVARVIHKCQTEGIKAISPSQSAVDDYNEHIRAFMPRTSWSSSCRSWYKRGHDEPDGLVTALHPGSRIHFFHMLEDFRGEDFDYVYVTDAEEGGKPSRSNRFRYLGNGFSTKELDPTFDTTWYLDNPALSGAVPPHRVAPGRALILSKL